MPKFIDLTGQRFGRLVVIRKEKSASQTRWLTRCDCGVERVVQGGNLKNGTCKSCGCLQRELLADRAKTANRRHGMTDSPTWSSWRAMIKRCEQPSSINYAAYGGRGISVCERWHIFENFAADMGLRSPGTSLDRIDVNGNYEPGNCRWATRSQQARNTTKTPKVVFNGVEYSISDLAERIGVSAQTIRARKRRGIPLDAQKWNGVRK